MYVRSDSEEIAFVLHEGKHETACSIACFCCFLLSRETARSYKVARSALVAVDVLKRDLKLLQALEPPPPLPKLVVKQNSGSF